MNDGKTEQSDKHCFDQQQVLANSLEILISHEKKSVLSDSSLPLSALTGKNLQGIKTFLTLEWACRCNAASSNFSQLGNAPYLCPGQPKMCLSAAPRAPPLILQSKPSIFFSSSLQESGVIARWPVGA